MISVQISLNSTVLFVNCLKRTKKRPRMTISKVWSVSVKGGGGNLDFLQKKFYDIDYRFVSDGFKDENSKF